MAEISLSPLPVDFPTPCRHLLLFQFSVLHPALSRLIPHAPYVCRVRPSILSLRTMCPWFFNRPQESGLLCVPLPATDTSRPPHSTPQIMPTALFARLHTKIPNYLLCYFKQNGRIVLRHHFCEFLEFDGQTPNTHLQRRCVTCDPTDASQERSAASESQCLSRESCRGIGLPGLSRLQTQARRPAKTSLQEIGNSEPPRSF